MDYFIHNGARDVETRTLRARQSRHRGLKQYVLDSQRRLLRGRPLRITEEELQKNLTQLQAQEKEGILYITSLDGRVLDLQTMELLAPPPQAITTPNRMLDDAAREPVTGVPMASLGDEPPPAHFVMPVQPPLAALDNVTVTAPLTTTEGGEEKEEEEGIVEESKEADAPPRRGRRRKVDR